MASSSSLFLIFFCFLFPLLFISQATVPPSETFRYVNTDYFGDSVEYQTEYDPTYRNLPPFTSPFILCFYNTTPNAYTLSLGMGTRRDRSMRRWVWEANRGNPVQENATLSLGSDGNLVLADADGRIAWQTNTANKGVVGFALLSNGNMVLRDANGNFIWQSFDSPTDTLLFGQSLKIGGTNKLVSRASTTENVNGVYSFVLEPKRLALYYKTMRYWSSSFTERDSFVNATIEIGETEYVDSYFTALQCRSLNPQSQGTLRFSILLYNSTLSFLRLGIDGNLRLYSYRQNVRSTAFTLVFTLLNRGVSLNGAEIEDECQLPDRCGKFGLCEDSQCIGCPKPNGFSAWTKDCVAKVPGCEPSSFRYYELKGVDHFTVKYSSGTGPVNRRDCDSKCTKDCKCLGYFYHTSIEVLDCLRAENADKSRELN